MPILIKVSWYGKFSMPRVTYVPAWNPGAIATFFFYLYSLQETLRVQSSCEMRTSEGNLLPVTSGKDQSQQNRFIAGDGRVNEHAVLTTLHTIWIREHNRLCKLFKTPGHRLHLPDADEETMFNKARAVRPCFGRV
jgi:hypothetical protein